MTDDADVKAKVLRQVEYYFSDDSFPFDDYMKGKCDGEGYVPLAEVCSFAKMKAYTTDVDVVKAALADSDAVVLSDDGTKLKRVYPCPDEDPNKATTVHCSGFATLEGKEAMEASIAAAMKKHGSVAAVRALRNLAQEARAYDGSALVTFEDEAAVASAVACTGAVMGGRKITIYALTDWFDRMRKKRDAMKKKKQQKEEDKKNGVVRAVEHTPKAAVLGCVLKFEGLDAVPEASREMLRSACEVGDIKVAYVEFERGQAEGFVRLAEPKAAELAAKIAADGKATLGGVDAAVAVLEGDAETEYHGRAAEAAKAARKRKGGGGKGGYRRKKHRS